MCVCVCVMKRVYLCKRSGLLRDGAPRIICYYLPPPAVPHFGLCFRPHYCPFADSVPEFGMLFCVFEPSPSKISLTGRRIRFTLLRFRPFGSLNNMSLLLCVESHKVLLKWILCNFAPLLNLWMIDWYVVLYTQVRLCSSHAWPPGTASSLFATVIEHNR